MESADEWLLNLTEIIYHQNFFLDHKFFVNSTKSLARRPTILNINFTSQLIILFTYPQLIDKNTHTFVHFVTDLFLYRRPSYSFSQHTWQMANSMLHLTVPADLCDSSSYTFLYHTNLVFINECTFVLILLNGLNCFDLINI